ncbi:MAG: response regulator [Janthinobacterium lividum]
MLHHLPINKDTNSEGPFQTQSRDADPSRSFAATSSFTSASSPEPVILLAEDDEDLLMLTGAFLKTTGYKVLSCSNGRIASEVFRRVPRVDLLLTDIRMPELSGIELARDLTQIEPSLPVLMISGGALTENLEEEIRQRGWQFLAKPWRFPDLLASVHAMLGSHFLKDASTDPW